MMRHGKGNLVYRKRNRQRIFVQNHLPPTEMLQYSLEFGYDKINRKRSQFQYSSKITSQSIQIFTTKRVTPTLRQFTIFVLRHVSFKQFVVKKCLSEFETKIFYGDAFNPRLGKHFYFFRVYYVIFLRCKKPIVPLVTEVNFVRFILLYFYLVGKFYICFSFLSLQSDNISNESLLTKLDSVS